MPARQLREQSSSGAWDGLEGVHFGSGYWPPAVRKRRLPAQERAHLRARRAPASKLSRRIYRSTLVTSSELTNSNDSDRFGIAIVTGATYLGWEPPLEEGVTKKGNTIEGKEVGINAVVQPPPGLTSIGTSYGPNRWEARPS